VKKRFFDNLIIFSHKYLLASSLKCNKASNGIFLTALLSWPCKPLAKNCIPADFYFPKCYQSRIIIKILSKIGNNEQLGPVDFVRCNRVKLTGKMIIRTKITEVQ
jgi:hypothetical protein